MENTGSAAQTSSFRRGRREKGGKKNELRTGREGPVGEGVHRKGNLEKESLKWAALERGEKKKKGGGGT